MKEAVFRSAALAIHTMLLLAASNVFAESGDHAQARTDQIAFGAFATSGLDTVAAYAKTPDNKDALPVRKYPQVVKQFNWWLGYALQPDYVPAPAFVEKHLLLIPARKTNGKEDMAFLSYELAGKRYMVVQTGGLSRRMWIFMHDPARKDSLDNGNEARAAAEKILAKHMSAKVREYLPAFSISKNKTLFVGEWEPSQTKKRVNRARWFLAAQDACISIEKVNPDGTLPGREPLPNEWFSWWEGPQ